jgi:hypothetical protein
MRKRIARFLARLAARPRLTDSERTVEFDRMSEDDTGMLLAYFADQFPGFFDTGLAALGSYRHEIEEAA